MKNLFIMVNWELASPLFHLTSNSISSVYKICPFEYYIKQINKIAMHSTNKYNYTTINKWNFIIVIIDDSAFIQNSFF